MKASTLFTTAILATCGISAPVTLTTSFNASSNNGTARFINQVPTNITAYYLALDACSSDLKKVSNETSARLGVDEKHASINACRKFISHMFPGIRHHFNATEDDHKAAVLHELKPAQKKEQLKCLSELGSNGDGSKTHMGHQRSVCMSRASKVVEALDRDLASIDSHGLETTNQDSKDAPPQTPDFSTPPQKNETCSERQEVDEQLSLALSACSLDFYHNTTIQGTKTGHIAARMVLFKNCTNDASKSFAQSLKSMNANRLDIDSDVPLARIMALATQQEFAFETLDHKLSSCQFNTFGQTMEKLVASGSRYASIPLQQCAMLAGNHFTNRMDEINAITEVSNNTASEHLPGHLRPHFNFSSYTDTSSSVNVPPAPVEATSLVKRTSRVWETLKVPEQENLLDEMKRLDTTDKFSQGVRKCKFEQGLDPKSTSESFQSCIKDVTRDFSNDLILIDDRKFISMIEVPDVFGKDSIAPWKSSREGCYKQLHEETDACRGQLQGKQLGTPASVTKRGLSDSYTRLFETCVKHAAKALQAKLDIVDDAYGPDLFFYHDHNTKPELNTYGKKNVRESIHPRDVEAVSEAASQSSFDNNELYSMASLAHSYWMNHCYDLVPYSVSYSSTDSEEFKHCAAQQDNKYKDLVTSIKHFLHDEETENIMHTAEHDPEFLHAVQQLRRKNYGCGGDGDCFASGIEYFLNAIHGLSDKARRG